MKANSAIEQLKCTGHEKRERLLISKMEINNQISLRNKKFCPFFFRFMFGLNGFGYLYIG